MQTYSVYETPPRSGKYTLIFVVKEMTLLKKVEFRGRKAIRLKEIEDTTGLKAGSRADPSQTRRAVSQIQELYREKGYDLASVTLLEGGNQGDTKIVIEIFEGPKAKVTSIDFKGNHVRFGCNVENSYRHPKIHFRSFVPGKYHAELLEDDRQKLVDYYYANGFFEAKVSPVTRSQDNPGEIGVTFVISEGTQYQVRNVIIEGNRRIKTEALRKDLELLSGKPFMLAMRDADKSRMLFQYGEIGCIDAQSNASRDSRTSSAWSTCCTRSRNDEPFSLGRAGDRRQRSNQGQGHSPGSGHGGPVAGRGPGQEPDRDCSGGGSMGLGYFMNDPQQNKQIKIDIVRQRPSDQPYGD